MTAHNDLKITVQFSSTKVDQIAAAQKLKQCKRKVALVLAELLKNVDIVDVLSGMQTSKKNCINCKHKSMVSHDYPKIGELNIPNKPSIVDQISSKQKCNDFPDEAKLIFKDVYSEFNGE